MGAAALILLLGLLRVPRATLGLAERADGGVAVDLLVAAEAGFHGGRLLSVTQRETAKLLLIVVNAFCSIGLGKLS